MSGASPSHSRTERLLAAIAMKLRSRPELLDQSKGAVKITAHPRADGFEVEVDIKL